MLGNYKQSLKTIADATRHLKVWQAAKPELSTGMFAEWLEDERIFYRDARGSVPPETALKRAYVAALETLAKRK